MEQRPLLRGLGVGEGALGGNVHLGAVLLDGARREEGGAVDEVDVLVRHYVVTVLE